MDSNELKCHLCGGKALLEMRSLALFDGELSIRDSPHYCCQDCKEEFATSEQMHQLSATLNRLRAKT